MPSPPGQNLLFGYGPGREVERRLLTLWNTVNFFLKYARLAKFVPAPDALVVEPVAEDGHVLDQWLAARRRQYVTEMTEALDAYLSASAVRATTAYLDDLSDWYVRLPRRRFWQGDPAALAALWRALVDAVRLLSPVTPFLTEHLWGALVSDVLTDAPDSVFLAGWPSAAPVEADTALLGEMAAVRRVVELGRQARGKVSIRGRQPLSEMVVEGVDEIAPYATLIATELRVHAVRFGPIQGSSLRVRPNLRVLGPRLGAGMRQVCENLAGQFQRLEDGSVRVGDLTLSPGDVLVDRTEKQGWTIASDAGLSVALNVELTDQLRLEGRVNDALHHVNSLRKDLGLGVAERIELWLPSDQDELLPFADRFEAENLAVRVETGDTPDYGIVPISVAAD